MGKQILHVLAATLLTGALLPSPASAKLKGMNGRIVVFRCNLDGVGFNRGPGSKPDDVVYNPDLIVSLNEEIVAGQAALVTKKSDFASLSDRRKVFTKAKHFSVSGRWPGGLEINGADKNDQKITTLTLSPSTFGPDLALASLVTATAGTHRGVCNVLHLKPAGFSL